MVGLAPIESLLINATPSGFQLNECNLDLFDIWADRYSLVVVLVQQTTLMKEDHILLATWESKTCTMGPAYS